MKVLEGHRGSGDYHETLSFLTQWKIIRELSVKPLTYNQIHKKTRIHRNELREILDLFIQKRCLFKHKLAKGILEKQRGAPEYYILNFDHSQIHDTLIGKIPNYIRLEYQKAKQATTSVRKMKKYWAILNDCIDYFSFVFLSQNSKLYTHEDDIEEDSLYEEPQFSKKTRLFYDIYQDERIQENLKQLKEVEDSIFSKQLEEKRLKEKKYLDIEKSCVNITSLLVKQFGLTVWDGFLMCTFSFDESKEFYFRIWKIFKNNYPHHFSQSNESDGCH